MHFLSCNFCMSMDEQGWLIYDHFTSSTLPDTHAFLPHLPKKIYESLAYFIFMSYEPFIFVHIKVVLWVPYSCICGWSPHRNVKNILVYSTSGLRTFEKYLLKVISLSPPLKIVFCLSVINFVMSAFICSYGICCAITSCPHVFLIIYYHLTYIEAKIFHKWSKTSLPCPFLEAHIWMICCMCSVSYHFQSKIIQHNSHVLMSQAGFYFTLALKHCRIWLKPEIHPFCRSRHLCIKCNVVLLPHSS